MRSGEKFELIKMPESDRELFPNWNMLGWICKYCEKRGIVEGCENCLADEHTTVRTFTCSECSEKKNFESFNRSIGLFGVDCRLCLKRDVSDFVSFPRPHPMGMAYAVCLECFNRFGFLLSKLTKEKAKSLRKLLRKKFGVEEK